MVQSFAIIAALASALVLTVGQVQAQPFHDKIAHHPHNSFGNVQKKYCDNDQYHCLYLGSGAQGTLSLKDGSKSITKVNSDKSDITLLAMKDGASGHISVSCKNGKQGAVAFTLDNKAGSTAEITAGGDSLNGIFKSRVGTRLAGGKISSHQAGDDLNVYCSL